MPSVLLKGLKGQTQLTICRCFEVGYKERIVAQVRKPMQNDFPYHEKKHTNYDAHFKKQLGYQHMIKVVLV